MATAETEAPAHAKAAGNSYSLHLRQGAPLLDSTQEGMIPSLSRSSFCTVYLKEYR